MNFTFFTNFPNYLLGLRSPYFDATSLNSVSTVFLFLIVVFLAIYFNLIHNNRIIKTNETDRINPPGPKPWPIWGSLHLLAKFPTPWDAFIHLKCIYGNVFQIKLGGKNCVVISSLEAMREVLAHKAHSFSGRPNFLRYHALFGGDRDRSLALCDWSNIQKIRRRLAIPYVFPRNNTTNCNQLESVIESELTEYVDRLSKQCDKSKSSSSKSGVEISTEQPGQTSFDKQHFSQVCANIFFRYFCSKRYSYEDTYFRSMVRHFDNIFQDINNGFALDFLPWLLPFHLFHLSKLYYYGQYIRRFLIDTLIDERSRDVIDPQRPRDFLDAVLTRTNAQKYKKKRRLTSDYAFYEVEDILGGHSAVSCFWARVLAQICHRPDVQQKIRSEIDFVASTMTQDGIVRLCHRSAMPYTQAAILETLRVTTSPIVPHVANEDCSIGGFHVPKDSMIFLNNYYVNTSDTYWKDPEQFEPSRFLTESGHLFKPDYFLPFSTGKRSCLGYQLVQSITFLATVKLVQNFDIKSSQVDANLNSKKGTEFKAISDEVEPAKLSVLDNSVKASFTKRYFKHKIMATKLATFSPN